MHTYLYDGKASNCQIYQYQYNGEPFLGCMVKCAYNDDVY